MSTAARSNFLAYCQTPLSFTRIALVPLVRARTQNMMLRVRGRGGGGADDPPPPDTIASCEPYPDLVDDASDRRHLVHVAPASASRPDTAPDADE